MIRWRRLRKTPLYRALKVLRLLLLFPIAIHRRKVGLA